MMLRLKKQDRLRRQDRSLRSRQDKCLNTHIVYYRERKIGLYVADLVVDNKVIVELKCCKKLLAEHQAQAINYLAAANMPVGLLVNFGHRKLEYKRVFHPIYYPAVSEANDPAGAADPVIF